MSYVAWGPLKSFAFLYYSFGPSSGGGGGGIGHALLCDSVGEQGTELLVAVLPSVGQGGRKETRFSASGGHSAVS